MKRIQVNGLNTILFEVNITAKGFPDKLIFVQVLVNPTAALLFQVQKTLHSGEK